MLIRKGDYSIIKDEEEKEVDEMPPDEEYKEGDPLYRGPEDTKIERVKAKEIKSDLPTKIQQNKVKPNWGDLTSKSLSRNSGSMSDQAKKILKELKSRTPAINWKKELKKFFTETFKAIEWVLPNKRLLGSGDTLYGRKQTGEDTLKTIVAAVDTSGSISKKQIKIFINEIMYLVKTFDCEKTVIIYCSDQVDAVEILKKGQEPDFTKIKSTGGNSQGFDPPFQWVEQNKIKPSIFIYMTDTGGSMPDPNKYGIRKYIKKVFWFICSTKLHNKPPFGRIFMAPPSAIDSSFDPF